MGELIGLVCYLLPVLMLLALGLFVGGFNERRHLKSLMDREQRCAGCMVTQLKSFPMSVTGPSTPQLLLAEAVISSDYLKSFLGNLRNIFGGEVKSFGILLERARREGILRLQEQAVRLGYNAICNVRIQTADIGGKANGKKGVVMAAVLVSATAYHAAAS